METNQVSQQEAAEKIYAYAANLMVEQKKSPAQAKAILVEKGMEEPTAAIVINNLEKEINGAKKSRAQKDMLFGALWCIGGTVATLANIGFIFWGAIVFGGFQFFRGLISYLGE